MIEIIPNWHPFFVHFTIALSSTAVGFYLLAFLNNKFHIFLGTISAEFDAVARWCLWVAALATTFTVAAGFYAYFTVKHDAVSHAAMTLHRNWALLTVSVIILAAIWSGWCHHKRNAITFTFIILLLIAQGLLLSTAWHGAEVVYRHGVGVISLPKAENTGHHHSEGMEMPHTH